MEEKIIIYTDGGSRGNPGESALGIYIPKFEKKYSEYLGIKTNNEAEYEAVIFALKKAKQLIGKEKSKKTEIEIKSDSELIIMQLSGEYKLKEEKLIQPFIKIWNLKQDFKKVIFTHIFREQNKKADTMVNKELDSRTQKLF
ncbi:MAG: ribonuclease HI family protein [Patescibacteria group bacterium]|nr:ribonuclease HI family protein [Patescibacteria group bacterium]